jgi:hypothetical protein
VDKVSARENDHPDRQFLSIRPNTTQKKNSQFNPDKDARVRSFPLHQPWQSLTGSNPPQGIPFQPNEMTRENWEEKQCNGNLGVNPRNLRYSENF